MYMFTGRLIQDLLENQFSVYRQKGCYDRIPTTRIIKPLFKLNIGNNFMQPSVSANAGSKLENNGNILESSSTSNDILQNMNVEGEEDKENYDNEEETNVET